MKNACRFLANLLSINFKIHNNSCLQALLSSTQCVAIGPNKLCVWSSDVGLMLMLQLSTALNNDHYGHHKGLHVEFSLILLHYLSLQSLPPPFFSFFPSMCCLLSCQSSPVFTSEYFNGSCIHLYICTWMVSSSDLFYICFFQHTSLLDCALLQYLIICLCCNLLEKKKERKENDPLHLFKVHLLVPLAQLLFFSFICFSHPHICQPPCFLHLFLSLTSLALLSSVFLVHVFLSELLNVHSE